MEMYEPADYDFISSDILYETYKIWCEKRGKKSSNYYNFIKEAERAMNIKETEGNGGDGNMVKGLKIKIRDLSKQQNIVF